VKRALKIAVVLVLALQWYARGGREFLFGVDPDDERFGVLDTFRTYVDLPPYVSLGDVAEWRAQHEGIPIRNPDGDQVGAVIGVRRKPDALDPAGREIEQWQVHGEFVRATLGFPINVALAQAQDFTRRSLGYG
jgi:hypothetical protein